MRTGSKLLRELFVVEGPAEQHAGLRITGDVDTLRVLAEIIDESSGEAADEYADWINKATIALSQAIRSGSGNVTLPSYAPAPSLDSFNDDGASGPDDDEEI